MKERILEFLKAENKSSAQFAEEIGVQPSGISHILSGRNNPSLDFVLKMLDKYKFLSTEWLLFGKGSMYKDSGMRTLFDQDLKENQEDSSTFFREVPPVKDDIDKTKGNILISKENSSRAPGSAVQRIVWFYEDNSFDEYLPRK